MSHYFITPESMGKRHEVTATIWEHTFTLLSADGVFSATRLDPGTSVLFRLAPPPEDRPARFLDLGCGFGPIALGIALTCPGVDIDAIDVNDQALQLTTDNASRLGVSDRVHASRPEDVPSDSLYDEIWSNPPIRIGKQALHDLLSTWLVRLTPEGKATLVVGKNLGADSLHSWLESQGWVVTRLGSAKGFRVLKVRR
ncbi:MAG: methyltransferase [Propionibacteriaceae bacterium]|jgi:16S rRNA G1207 methylase RsmC|nr:methyltransferase [Propionibacteriaceae bacterium]